MNSGRARRRGVLHRINASFKHWSLLPAVIVFVVLTGYPMFNLLRMIVSTVEFKGGKEIWSWAPSRHRVP